MRKFYKIKNTKMEVIPRIRKMFGKGCGEFKLINPTDKILVPIDADFPTQTLAACIFAKVRKMPQKPTILLIHLFQGTDVDDETKEILDEFLKKCPMDIIYEHHDPVNERKELLTAYVEAAIKNGCNKVAIPDTVNFINAMIIATMCQEGIFNGPDIAQHVQLSPDQPEIVIIRPFCYMQDQDIKNFVRKNNLREHPSAISVPEENAATVAREAIQIIYSEDANIHMNLFNSQFTIQDKYLGAGDGKTREVLDFSDDE